MQYAKHEQLSTEMYQVSISTAFYTWLSQRQQQVINTGARLRPHNLHLNHYITVL